MFRKRHSRSVGRSAVLLALCALLVNCQAPLQTVPGTAQSSAPGLTVSLAAAPSRTAANPSASGPTAAPSANQSPAAAFSTAPTVSQSLAAASSATPTVSQRPAEPLATLDTLDALQLPPRDPVELAYQFGRTADQQRVARTTPLTVQLGDKQEFTITNPGASVGDPAHVYSVTATLQFMFEHVLVYVENGVDVDLAELERSSRRFNDSTYRRTRNLFGSEWQPGIDGDPRLTILNARIPGIGGFFSINDELPRSVNRFSNEREMFYINLDSAPPGTAAYDSTLAHEFQHMIQWHVSQQTATWFNEGLAQLAEELNGFEEDATGGQSAYLVNPDLQLTDWGDSPQEAVQNYGASFLFMSYFHQHYGSPETLHQLVTGGAGRRLQLFAELARPHNPGIGTFADLYADWSVANLLNDPQLAKGQYSYRLLPETTQPVTLAPTTTDTVAQFGSDYWMIQPSAQERVLRFDGSDTIGVVAAQPEDRTMWWSNRGDNTYTTLTRSVDLRMVSSATMQFRLWHDLEDGWDYGFVIVSTDGGQRWTTLPGRHTTADNPQDANFGYGYTGKSGVTATLTGEPADGEQPRWLDEQIDLTPYAGQNILLRFSVVHDQSTNRSGMALDTIRIPEIGFEDDAETGNQDWQAAGFVRTDNRFEQQWTLRLVRRNGSTLTVEPLALDDQQRGTYRIGPGEHAALIVMATTPHTTERAGYELRVARP